MQIFEQHSMSEGACQFALAALEQVDDIFDLDNGTEAESLPETAAMIKGRLWANVFKYSLDLKHFQDAYCAIISNPDDDSKYICLRRFIIVLCELGETKVGILSCLFPHILHHMQWIITILSIDCFVVRSFFSFLSVIVFL